MWFIEALKPRTSKMALAKNCKTLQEAIEIASREEAVNQMNNNSRNAHINFVKFNNRNSNNNNNKVNNINRSRSSPNLKQSNGSSRGKPLLCYFCKSPNHVARNCNKKPQKEGKV